MHFEFSLLQEDAALFRMLNYNPHQIDGQNDGFELVPYFLRPKVLYKLGKRNHMLDQMAHGLH
jgi:hypothetical protein